MPIIFHYGYRWVTAALKRQGMTINHKKVAKMMKSMGMVIDAFSRKIVGYTLGRALATQLPLEALKMTINSRDTGDLIHHPDKGIQHCSHEYVDLLNTYGITIP